MHMCVCVCIYIYIYIEYHVKIELCDTVLHIYIFRSDTVLHIYIFRTKLSFRFCGLITLFHRSIPVQGSRVIITPDKL